MASGYINVLWITQNPKRKKACKGLSYLKKSSKNHSLVKGVVEFSISNFQFSNFPTFVYDKSRKNLY